MCTEAVPASPAELEEPQPHADAPLPSPLRDEELPWCASADDPRCAPLHNSSAPSSVDARQAPALDANAKRAEPLAGVDHEFVPHAGLAPRVGATSRLERPPRTARRSP